MKEPPLVVGVGELLWDLFPDGRRVGGAPANVAAHARGLGAEATVVSAVGSDPLGDEILEHLEGRGLETGTVVRLPDRPTGTVTVALDEGGHPSYTIHEGVAWDAIPLAAGLVDLARRADAVCFGTLAQRAAVSRRTIRRFLSETRNDCLRMFDINLRQSYFDRETIECGLAAASAIKLNDEEWPVVARLLALDEDESAGLKTLVCRNELEFAALTRGGEGSALYAADGSVFERPGSAVAVADTVGAGDAFTAALVAGKLAGDSWRAIHERAERLAGFVCTKSGATPALPTSFRLFGGR